MATTYPWRLVWKDTGRPVRWLTNERLGAECRFTSRAAAQYAKRNGPDRHLIRVERTPASSAASREKKEEA